MARAASIAARSRVAASTSMRMNIARHMVLYAAKSGGRCVPCMLQL